MDERDEQTEIPLTQQEASGNVSKVVKGIMKFKPRAPKAKTDGMAMEGKTSSAVKQVTKISGGTKEVKFERVPSVGKEERKTGSKLAAKIQGKGGEKEAESTGKRADEEVSTISQSSTGSRIEKANAETSKDTPRKAKSEKGATGSPGVTKIEPPPPKDSKKTTSQKSKTSPTTTDAMFSSSPVSATSIKHGKSKSSAKLSEASKQAGVPPSTAKDKKPGSPTAASKDKRPSSLAKNTETVKPKSLQSNKQQSLSPKSSKPDLSPGKLAKSPSNEKPKEAKKNSPKASQDPKVTKKDSASKSSSTAPAS